MKRKILVILSLFLLIGGHLQAMVHTPLAGQFFLPPPREPDFSDWRVIVSILAAIFYGQFGLHFFLLGYKDRGFQRLFSSIAAYGLILIGYVTLLASQQIELGLYLIIGGIVWVLAIKIKSLLEAAMIATGQIQPLDKVLGKRQVL